MSREFRRTHRAKRAERARSGKAWKRAEADSKAYAIALAPEVAKR